MREGAVTKRPSETHIREAAVLDGMHILAAACPKDVLMYRDAVKTTGDEERIEFKDLIELVYAAI